MVRGPRCGTVRHQAAILLVSGPEVAIYPVTTGTAANALALSTLTPPYGAVYCHKTAHIAADKCGAPKIYTAGAANRRRQASS
jgi:threonine aldolase